MPRQLPDRPSLDQLKNQAKDLLKGHKAGNPDALRRIHEIHPRFSALTTDEIAASRFTLSSAQLIIAHEYGFAGWTKLKSRVESLARAEVDVTDQLRKAIQADDASRALRSGSRAAHSQRGHKQPASS
ncbi:MAG: hypothetical protein ABSE84_05255, partial [Isosphaeraceae bacterium]